MKSLSANDIKTQLESALSAHRNGDLKSATERYRSILQVDPDHAAATQLLGTVALQSQRFKEARRLLTRAVELDDASGVSWHNLARVNEAEGDLQSAAQHYEQAFKLMPDNADTSFSLANVLTSLGELEKSEHWYRKTLDVNPAYASAHRQLARLLDHKTVDEDMQAMEQLFDRQATNDASRMQLAFGLGKAYEDLQEFDRAFSYYETANRLKRATLRFNIDDWGREVDRVVSAFNSPLFEQFSNAGKKKLKPIFILGMPRSGTSLVEQILASHSEVYGGGELQLLNLSVMQGMDVSQFPGNVAHLPEHTFATIAQTYLEKTGALAGDSRLVTDKKPDNFKLIGMIRLLFPDAVVIHTCRHPMDNCLSLFKNHFSDNGPFYSYDQSELGQYYRGYQRLMEHWHTVLPEFVYDVQYEALVSNQEDETRALLARCGLEYEEACLNFHRTSRGVRTASAVQVRKSIYSSSVELWRRYETHLAPLAKSLE